MLWWSILVFPIPLGLHDTNPDDQFVVFPLLQENTYILSHPGVDSCIFLILIIQKISVIQPRNKQLFVGLECAD